MSEYHCPKCESLDVVITTQVSECLQCGWSEIGEHDCDICGRQAVGYCGFNGRSRYFCRDHSEGMRSETLRSFAAAVMGSHRK